MFLADIKLNKRMSYTSFSLRMYRALFKKIKKRYRFKTYNILRTEPHIIIMNTTYKFQFNILFFLFGLKDLYDGKIP